MAQIISDPYSSGNIVGALGRSFGQGLAEQLPKAVERGRLSYELKKLGESGTTMTPFQQAAALYSLPGGAENASVLLPLLQQQQARQQFLNQQKQPVPVSPKEQKEVVSDLHKLSEAGFASPEAVRDVMSKLAQKPSKEAIENWAKANAYLYPTSDIKELKALGKAELEQEYEENQTKLNTIQKDLSDRVKLELQGLGIGDYEDVPGEIQNKLLDQAKHMVFEQKLTPEEASNKISDVITDLGKNINLLRESATRPFWQASEQLTDLRSQRPQFAKYGFGEIFDNMAAGNLGVSRLEIAHELDPIQNKEIEKIFSKGPKMFQKEGKKMKEARIKEIASHIRPKDNLLDIEYRLREQGLSIDKFRNEVSRLVRDKALALSPEQQRQLNTPSSQSFLGDILFETFKRFK